MNGNSGSWVAPASDFAHKTINPIRRLVDTMKLVPNKDKDMIVLTIGDPTVYGNMYLPQVAEDAVVAAIQSKKYNGYGPSVGLECARKAVAAYETTPSFPIDAKDVILTSGCSSAIDLCITVLANKGQNILVPRPGFSLYKTVANSVDIEIKFYNLLVSNTTEYVACTLLSLSLCVVCDCVHMCIFFSFYLLLVSVIELRPYLGTAVKSLINPVLIFKFVAKTADTVSESDFSFGNFIDHMIEENAQGLGIDDQSDVPVSSVHTSDLSDFREEEISDLSTLSDDSDYDDLEWTDIITDTEKGTFIQATGPTKPLSVTAEPIEYLIQLFPTTVFHDQTFHSVASLSTDVPVLTCSGIAKRFLVPGWRMGWIVINDRGGVFEKEIRGGLLNLSQKILGPCTLVQGALPNILKNTEKSFFDSIITIVEENAKFCYESFLRIPGLKPVMPQGALYMMCFQMPNYFRLVLTLPHDKVQVALGRLSEYCAKYYSPLTYNSASSDAEK
eukprot:XP_014773956.1 PREDICTED: tyrosine aminotransferase-like [Octopus bimaculoides]